MVRFATNALAAVCLAVSRAPAVRAAAQGDASPTAAEIQRDLVLETRITAGTTVRWWWPLETHVVITNRSADRSYPIVLPGDGSSDGRREPHCYLTVDLQQPDGTWRRSPSRGGGICGNYDSYWLRSVVVLGPGESRDLLPYATGPWGTQGLASSRIRVQARYAYRAIPSRRNQWDPDSTPVEERFGRMQDMPPFELVSAPVEIQFTPSAVAREAIESDLALELQTSISGTVRAWGSVTLSAQLVNRSATATHRVVRPRPTAGESDRVPAFVLSGETSSPDVYKAERLSFQMRTPGADRDLDWRDDVVELPPGAALELAVELPRAQVRLTGCTRLRLELEYSYNPRVPSIRWVTDWRAAEAFGRMADVPPFSLRSNALEWAVENPLMLECRPRTGSADPPTSKLSSRIEILLRNQSSSAVEISTAADPAEVRLEGLYLLDVLSARLAGSLTLGPGEEISLIGSPTLEQGFDPALPPGMEVFPHARGDLRALVQRRSWAEPVVSPAVPVDMRH